MGHRAPAGCRPRRAVPAQRSLRADPGPGRRPVRTQGGRWHRHPVPACVPAASSQTGRCVSHSSSASISCATWTRRRRAPGSRSTRRSSAAPGRTSPISRGRAAIPRARVRASRPRAGSLGQDGIYEKDGTRLAAEIVVRGEVQERVRMVDMMAKDARDCGMDLRVQAGGASGEILDMLERFPHAIPGTDRPFDIYVGCSPRRPIRAPSPRRLVARHDARAP